LLRAGGGPGELAEMSEEVSSVARMAIHISYVGILEGVAAQEGGPGHLPDRTTGEVPQDRGSSEPA